MNWVNYLLMYLITGGLIGIMQTKSEIENAIKKNSRVKGNPFAYMLVAFGSIIAYSVLWFPDLIEKLIKKSSKRGNQNGKLGK